MTVDTALVLACGHVAAFRERFRHGPDKWCGVCCRWQPLAHPSSGDIDHTE